MPPPGGWNRLVVEVVEVDDVSAAIALLDGAGVRRRNEPLTGPGGTQVLIDDPPGNPIELFAPRR